MESRIAKPSRRDILRYAGGAAGLAAVAPALVAFPTEAEALKAQQALKKFTMGQSPLTQTGPTSFNALTGEGRSTYQLVYSGLLQWNTSYTKLEPDLATSWSVSNDSKTYTFKLRKGVTWHDGKPFTSADVKFTFQTAGNPDVAAWIYSYLPSIASIDTPDDHTVVLNLTGPDATLFSTATLLNIVPQHRLSGMAPATLVNSPYWYTNPVGTGPFKWTSYKPNQFATLTPYKKYWGGAPKLDQIVWVFYSSAAASVVALQKQTINYTTLAVTDLGPFQENANFKVIGTPSGVTTQLALNMSDPRFQPLAVRQAMLYAIDRKAIIKSLYQGGAQIANALLTIPTYVPKSLIPYGYNPQKAKQLLASANWDSLQGEPIEMVTYYNDPTSLNTMTAIQSYFAKVGIKITTRSVDSATWSAGKNTWTLAYDSLSNGPDPDVTRATYTTSGNNNHFTHVSVPELDKLYQEGRTTSGTARTKIYQQLNSVFNSQLPGIPLWTPTRYAGITSNIKNFVWEAHSDAAYQTNAQNWTVGGKSNNK